MTDTVSLKMDTPVEHSLLDQDAQAVIGRPLDRVDGPLKVAGRATYAAEYQIDDVAHGFRSVPLYVRAGAVIPLGPVKQWPEAPSDEPTMTERRPSRSVRWVRSRRRRCSRRTPPRS